MASVRMVITDLTRMQRGRVCIAGYDTGRRCIRPVLPPPGIAESSLVVDEKPIVFPFAVVELDLLRHTPQPPHTEDWRYDPNSLKFVRPLEMEKRKQILGWSLFHSLSEVFEQPIHSEIGHHVLDDQGSRSLGTIIPQTITKVSYSQGPEGAWDYRLTFIDDGAAYSLKITDLTWHIYCDSLLSEFRRPAHIAEDLTQMLKQREVFLRIGLSRGWSKFPGKCFLQINAIHTFPDYLNGKTFADFRADH